jgi:hypothetical protein
VAFRQQLDRREKLTAIRRMRIQRSRSQMRASAGILIHGCAEVGIEADQYDDATILAQTGRFDNCGRLAFSMDSLRWPAIAFASWTEAIQVFALES